jgi:glycosyltransferase involved in cell wall biosynthesis
MVAAGTPKVSVIMAAWNASRTIEAALVSMQAQSYENFELIIVDDGSDDNTSAIALAASARDSRIRLLRSEQNAGAAHARNLGLQACSGDFITFHDSDDRSHPERIERQLVALLRAPEKMFCLCNYSRVDDAGKVLRINGREVSKSVISMMFRRSVFVRQGYFLPLRISEDAEYYSRMKTIFGAAAEITLFPVLYWQGFSAGSLLFSDGETTSEGGSVVHTRSQEAEALLREIELQHEQIRAGLDEGYVAFSHEKVPFA